MRRTPSRPFHWPRPATARDSLRTPICKRIDRVARSSVARQAGIVDRGRDRQCATPASDRCPLGHRILLPAELPAGSSDRLPSWSDAAVRFDSQLDWQIAGVGYRALVGWPFQGGSCRGAVRGLRWLIIPRGEERLLRRIEWRLVVSIVRHSGLVIVGTQEHRNSGRSPPADER